MTKALKLFLWTELCPLKFAGGSLRPRGMEFGHREVRELK